MMDIFEFKPRKGAGTLRMGDSDELVLYPDIVRSIVSTFLLEVLSVLRRGEEACRPLYAVGRAK